MNTLTIQLSDTQRQRAETLASQRGETVEALIQEVFEAYLEEMEDAEIVRGFEARRAAGTAEVRDWDKFEAELDGEIIG